MARHTHMANLDNPVQHAPSADTPPWMWLARRATAMNELSPELRWWSRLSATERIVTTCVVVGGVVAVVNSTAWAIATSYMARQRARVALHVIKDVKDASAPPQPHLAPPPPAQMKPLGRQAEMAGHGASDNK